MTRTHAFVLSIFVLVLTSATKAQSQKVNYVTGCIGSESVTLHEATSSADDVRAVFVYKGGEILCSDIIPADGNYKSRLQVNRRGEVILSNLRLDDSGVYKVEMAMRNNKSSTSIVLFMPEPPQLGDERLRVLTVTSSDKKRVRRLACGRFISLGFPSVSVQWQDPDGRVLTSTGYQDGYFHLDLEHDSPAGNYTCRLHCCSPSLSCCLPHYSPFLQEACAYVPECPTCSEATSPEVREEVTSELPSELTSVLQKTGHDMAAGMAALVNVRIEDTLQSNVRQLNEWKQKLRDELDQKLRDMRLDFEATLDQKLEAKLEEAFDEKLEKKLEEKVEVKLREILEKLSKNQRENGQEKSFKNAFPFTINVVKPETATDILGERVGDRLQLIEQQVDELKRNVTYLQKTVFDRLALLHKKVKTTRQHVKKHSNAKLSKTIRTLTDEMRQRFDDVYDKISDWESEHQLSDEEIFANFQQTVTRINNKINEDRLDLRGVLTNVTDSIEIIRKDVTLLEENIISVEERMKKCEGKKPGVVKVDSKSGLGYGSSNVINNKERKENQREESSTYGKSTTIGFIPPTTSAPKIENNRRFGRFTPGPPTDTVFENCLALQQKGNSESGPYRLHPVGLVPQPFWCDMDSGEGGWLVIQRRRNGSVDFFRPWKDYVEGFGDQSGDGEFWLGLDKLHTLTRKRPQSLRVDLTTFDGVRGFAEYRRFRVLSDRHNYRLSVFGYSGTAGDSLVVHNKPFSTWDDDNDDWSEGHCAKNYHSAWWYAGCRICDLNAPYIPGPDGIMWLYGDDTWGAGKIAFAEMKIRPL